MAVSPLGGSAFNVSAPAASSCATCSCLEQLRYLQLPGADTLPAYQRGNEQTSSGSVAAYYMAVRPLAGLVSDRSAPAARSIPTTCTHSKAVELGDNSVMQW